MCILLMELFVVCDERKVHFDNFMIRYLLICLQKIGKEVNNRK